MNMYQPIQILQLQVLPFCRVVGTINIPFIVVDKTEIILKMIAVSYKLGTLEVPNQAKFHIKKLSLLRSTFLI